MVRCGETSLNTVQRTVAEECPTRERESVLWGVCVCEGGGGVHIMQINARTEVWGSSKNMRFHE